MARAGIERLVLEAKEGLALSNGIDFMAAAGALAVHDAENLLRTRRSASALSFEALLGLTAAYERALRARGQPGQPGRRPAARARRRQRDGRLPAAARAGCLLRALRAAGAGGGARPVAFARGSSRRINAVTDNPLIFLNDRESKAVSGGNFHGQAAGPGAGRTGDRRAEVGSISERRIFRSDDRS